MTKLNPDLYMLPIEIGTILYQKTSDEIQMSLEGDIRSINEHEEPWVVEDINVSRETLKLYNLQTGRVYRMYFKELNYISNWKVIESRLHDLKIEINTYKKVLEMLDNE